MGEKPQCFVAHSPPRQQLRRVRVRLKLQVSFLGCHVRKHKGEGSTSSCFVPAGEIVWSLFCLTYSSGEVLRDVL